MSTHCTTCGQFAGDDHECPEWVQEMDPDTCELEGCDEPLNSDQRHFCSRDHYLEDRRGDTEGRTCELDGCEKSLTPDQDRFCSQAHFTEWRNQRPADTKECALDGCDNQHTNKAYCSRDCAYAARQEEESTRDADVELSQDRYFIARDEDGDPYQVVFSIEGRLVRVPFARWDQLCRDYSSYGGGMTQAEVARKHGAPLPLVKRALSAYGQYHASPPMARERLAEADELEPLFSEAIETQEQQFLVELERRQEKKVRREWKEMKQELEREERHTEAAQRVASEFEAPESPSVIVPDTGKATAAVAATSDEQIGRPVWGEGTWGINFDTDIGCQRIVAQGEEGASWVAEQGGVETLYRLYNGDFFEGLSGETDHGTPMDLDTRFERVWDAALEAVMQNAQAWRQVCDRLVIVFIRGNHDGSDIYKFGSTIRMGFEGADDVEVRATPKMYDSVRVEDSLHVFDHGYRLSKLSGYKAKVDAERISRNVSGEKFHGADHIYYYVGHEHKREVDGSGDHLEIRRLPALCETSRWEHEGRYVTHPCADLFLLDERGRIDTPKRLYRDTLDGAV